MLLQHVQGVEQEARLSDQQHPGQLHGDQGLLPCPI